ncbi:E3 ubiquitin-protein ligase RNF182 isoform X2 [Perca fluviatilis]|nr:E3 ubiquitin-protein ligase RNF182 isoform X2 [Perca fluviatilis]XP_039652454.1 E3 ubiquitin-protein ligase RNF182 isoform X2 [Perca fluviatilis]
MSLLKGAEPGPEMDTKVQTWAPSLEELECKICFSRYDARSRKPKLLRCRHLICARCLKKMVNMGESSPCIISCPFCRHETRVPDDEVWLMEDDRYMLAVLSHQDQFKRGEEMLLSPHSLPGGSVDSDFMLISVMALTEDSPSMLSLFRPTGRDLLPANLPVNKFGTWKSCSIPRCLLGALCLWSGQFSWMESSGNKDQLFCSMCRHFPSGADSQSEREEALTEVYFSSLPLGIYLLMIGRLCLGVAMVSLVPSTLLLLVLYGFCQCVCTELCTALREKLAACTHLLP